MEKNGIYLRATPDTLIILTRPDGEMLHIPLSMAASLARLNGGSLIDFMYKDLDELGMEDGPVRLAKLIIIDEGVI